LRSSLLALICMLVLIVSLHGASSKAKAGNQGSSQAAALRSPQKSDQGKSADPAPGASVIQHVIIMMQENRTPDNLFHALPGADIANVGINSKGRKIKLEPQALDNNYGLGHLHPDFIHMYDGGKMDGADLVSGDCGDNCPPNMQFKYVRAGDVKPYFSIAEQYAFADRMFQSNQGPSYPAHQYIIAATSAPSKNSVLFDSENTFGNSNAHGDAGCGASAEVFTQLIDPLGQEKLVTRPCFDHITLMDLLDNKGLTWKYYTISLTYIWTGPNAISHIYYGKDWSNVVASPKQVLNDISGGRLANVTWSIPPGPSSDHPHGNNGSGPSWIASVVNAVGNSKYWNSTAIFVTWDDWGGWYDHVAPPIRNSYEYSFRVPLLVVSPYVKPGYVSHVNHDFSSIVKFVETVFGLPSLGFGDAYSDDLTDCFNFKQKPLRFHTIKAPLDANHFLSDNSPPTDPDEY